MIRSNPTRVAAVLLAIAASILASGCSDSSPAAAVTGEAHYRERIAAPPGARLEVTLADASTADPSERLITRIVIAKAGQPPFPFEVPYRPEDLDSDHRYVIEARLLDREQLLFETPAPVPVITQGNPAEIELLLQRAGTAAGT